VPIKSVRAPRRKERRAAKGNELARLMSSP